MLKAEGMSQEASQGSQFIGQGASYLALAKSRVSKSACIFGLILFVFLVLQFFLPLGSAIKIGADEDYELTKATLCLRGYHLYTEIWNDQPPLYPFLITQ